jgi:hypothetical protein
MARNLSKKNFISYANFNDKTLYCGFESIVYSRGGKEKLIQDLNLKYESLHNYQDIYSHSIVPGGLFVKSKNTNWISGIFLSSETISFKISFSKG